MQQKVEDSMLLYNRVLNHNAAAYLTIMSIIQGVALSFYTFEIIKCYQNTEAFAGMTPASYLLALSTLLIIIITWHEYIIGISMFTWFHGLLDTLIPFSIFIIEIMLILTMFDSSNTWYLLAAIFSMIALIAFINQYCKALREKENRDLLHAIKRWIYVTIIHIVLLIILYLLAWGSWSKEISTYLAGTSLALIVLFFIRAKVYWSKVFAYAKKNSLLHEK